MSLRNTMIAIPNIIDTFTLLGAWRSGLKHDIDPPSWQSRKLSKQILKGIGLNTDGNGKGCTI